MRISLVDYSAQEKEYGNGMKTMEKEKGPPFKLGMGPSEGLIRPCLEVFVFYLDIVCTLD